MAGFRRLRDHHGLVQRDISGGKAVEANLLGLLVRDAAPTAPVWLATRRVQLGRLAPHALRRLKVRQGVLKGADHLAHACRTGGSVVSQWSRRTRDQMAVNWARGCTHPSDRTH